MNVFYSLNFALLSTNHNIFKYNSQNVYILLIFSPFELYFENKCNDTSNVIPVKDFILVTLVKMAKKKQ